MDHPRTDTDICLDALRVARSTLSRYVDPLFGSSPIHVLEAMIELLDSDEISAALKRIERRADLRIIDLAIRPHDLQLHSHASFELPRCTECNVLREAIDAEPVAQRYEIRSYECPACKSILKLVERTEPTLFPRPQP